MFFGHDSEMVATLGDAFVLICIFLRPVFSDWVWFIIDVGSERIVVCQFVQENNQVDMLWEYRGVFWYHIGDS